MGHGLDLDRERRVHALLLEALALPSERRRDHVVGAAGDDRDLAAEVLDLLGSDGGLDGFLETPPAVDLADVPPDLPSRIGPFTILERLGSGGMGEVFRARQEEPVLREVALKRVRAHLPPEALDRFLVEQQALARLSHTNVARLYDAGTTADGRPYFAMELVQGRPVTDYCDDERLGVEERLKVFLGICAGVEHAHQKQLLHRDLKPSNVLVVEESGRPVPKVIDFGIAKPLGELETGLTVETRIGGLVGTPAYMSPEALSLVPAEGGLDTRTDVYSLGVLLYELLTGRSPFEEAGTGLIEVISKIGEGRAETPSRRLRRLSEEESSEVAARRGIGRADLMRRVGDDLDWIVARAMARERERRYGSVGELAADVERHLRDEPVEARPPSTVYVLRKALRRHRTVAIAAALVLIALVLGFAGTSLALLRARRAEGRAVAAATAAEEARAESDRVVEFLTGLFAESGPDARGANRPPSEVTALELLERGGEHIDRELAAQPRIRARVERTVGRAYRQLGLYDQALKHLQDAADLAAAEDPPDALEVARSLADLADLAVERGDYRGALAPAERSLSLSRSRPEAPPVQVGAGALRLGTILWHLGDHAAARERFAEALAALEAAGEAAAGDLAEAHRTVAALGVE